jgi:hypothetical protein
VPSQAIRPIRGPKWPKKQSPGFTLGNSPIRISPEGACGEKQAQREKASHRGYGEVGVGSLNVQLYTQTAQRRAVDPNIGPRLPGLLAKAGFEKIQLNVVQNAAMSGEVKLMAPLTMENIADAVLAAGLASRAELDRLVHELSEFARDPDTVIGGPRVVEAWGHHPLRAT